MNETLNCYWMRLVLICLNVLVCNVAQAQDDMVDNIKLTLVGYSIWLQHPCKEYLGSNTLPYFIFFFIVS